MQNIPQLSPHSFLAAQPAKQFDASPQDFPARLRDLPVDSSHTKDGQVPAPGKHGICMSHEGIKKNLLRILSGTLVGDTFST